MSKQSNDIYDLLVKTFPYSIVKKEYYIKYKGQKLFFDFYVKDFNLLFEVQGRQHSEYVSHFHGNRQGFLETKRRDNLKIQYCQENDLDLITINYDEEIITSDELIEKINSILSR